jgi:hypothetical protein
MTKDEALKLALEALEFFKNLSLSMKEMELAEDAITAIREALAQPPLPVQPEERWLCRTCNKSFTDLTIIHTCTPPQGNT